MRETGIWVQFFLLEKASVAILMEEMCHGRADAGISRIMSAARETNYSAAVIHGVRADSLNIKFLSQKSIFSQLITVKDGAGATAADHRRVWFVANSSGHTAQPA